MRVLISVAIAGAIVTAVPAVAQNTAAPAANAAATNATAPPNNAMTAVPAGVVTVGGKGRSADRGAEDQLPVGCAGASRLARIFGAQALELGFPAQRFHFRCTAGY